MATGTLAPYWKKRRITEQAQNENRRRAGRLFALFTLPIGPTACYVLKEEVLQSVRALVEEERSESFSITLTKRITYTGLKELRKDLSEPVGQLLTTSSIHEGPNPVTTI